MVTKNKFIIILLTALILLGGLSFYLHFNLKKEQYKSILNSEVISNLKTKNKQVEQHRLQDSIRYTTVIKNLDSVIITYKKKRSFDNLLVKKWQRRAKKSNDTIIKECAEDIRYIDSSHKLVDSILYLQNQLKIINARIDSLNRLLLDNTDSIVKEKDKIIEAVVNLNNRKNLNLQYGLSVRNNSILTQDTRLINDVILKGGVLIKRNTSINMGVSPLNGSVEAGFMTNF